MGVGLDITINLFPPKSNGGAGGGRGGKASSLTGVPEIADKRASIMAC